MAAGLREVRWLTISSAPIARTKKLISTFGCVRYVAN
jgi:hypothetical protein